MRSVCLIVVFSTVLFALSETTASQTGWSNGSGVEGPVAYWGQSYWVDSLLTTSSGQLSLTTCYQPIKHNVNGGSWECVIIADIDNDGDMDICGSNTGSSIRWWENTNGTGTSLTEHTVTTETGNTWIDAGDVDGDGDVDLLSAFWNTNGSAFYWWENTDGTGTGWQKHTIGGESMTQPNCIQGADIDGDGDLDAIGSAGYDNYIELFINTDGIGGSWSSQHLDPDNGADNIAVFDFDGDGDVDAAAVDWNEICWYENSGSGMSWSQHVVSSSGNDQLSTVDHADIDGDGDTDLVYAGNFRKVCWCENTDGAGSDWTGHFLPNCHSTGAMAAATGDFNGDGTSDIVAGFDWANSVEWWSNDGGTGSSWTHYGIDDVDTPYAFCTGDLDGDGTDDPIGAGEGALKWWEPVWEPLAGSLTSSILDTRAEPKWGLLLWEAQIHNGNSISFQLRSSSDSADMGSWSDTIMLPCSLSAVLSPGDRFIQYKAIFERVDAETIPVLEEISISYSSDTLGVPEDEYHLFDPFPNPTSGLAVVNFQLPLDGNVKATLYDMSGRNVSTLMDQEVPAGIYGVFIGDLEPGMYFVRVESELWSETVSLVVIE